MQNIFYRAIDAHCDTVGLFNAGGGYDFAVRNTTGHLDLPRMQEGGIKIQFFALYIREEYASSGALRYCLMLLDSYYQTMDRCRDQVRTILSGAGLRQVMPGSKTGAILSVEGGEALEGELAVLPMLFRLGVRALGLTWNHRNQLATGVGADRPDEGLTSFGRQVIKEMNKLGMLVDLAHINEKGFYEAIGMSSAPLIVSHANSRALCDHPRNITDEQLRALRDAGGVVGLVFNPPFVDPREATMDRLIDHFVHIAEVAGVDHLGLGSDFDGIDTVIEGLEDVTGLPGLIEGLSARGFDSADIEKITCSNFLRVLETILPPGSF